MKIVSLHSLSYELSYYDIVLGVQKIKRHKAIFCLLIQTDNVVLTQTTATFVLNITATEDFRRRVVVDRWHFYAD